MSGPLISSRSDYRNTFPRTQREAGIEFRGWEDKLPKIRPLWQDAVAGAFIIAFMVAAFHLAGAIAY